MLCGSSERNDAVTCSQCGEATWAEGLTSEPVSGSVGSVSNELGLFADTVISDEPEKPVAPAKKKGK